MSAEAGVAYQDIPELSRREQKMCFITVSTQQRVWNCGTTTVYLNPGTRSSQWWSFPYPPHQVGQVGRQRHANNPRKEECWNSKHEGKLKM